MKNLMPFKKQDMLLALDNCQKNASSEYFFCIHYEIGAYKVEGNSDNQCGKESRSPCQKDYRKYISKPGEEHDDKPLSI